jgi:PhnB protein
MLYVPERRFAAAWHETWPLRRRDFAPASEGAHEQSYVREGLEWESMTSSVKAIPEGYHSVTPYLIVSGAADAIEFYRSAFGAREVMRLAQPGGKVGHAEIEIGDSRIMLADEYPDMDARSPTAFGGTPVSLHLYVDDVDAIAQQAIAAGARERRPVKDQFYGDRTGSLEDPFGHVWHIASHKEDLSPDEIKRRADEAMRQQGGG